MVSTDNVLVSTVTLPLPANPQQWARDELALGWGQILVFVTAAVGILSVFFIVRVITRG